MQYEFLNDGILFRARNEFNEYSFSSVQVEDAGDGYECRVYDGDTTTPLATARGTLHVTSINVDGIRLAREIILSVRSIVGVYNYLLLRAD